VVEENVPELKLRLLRASATAWAMEGWRAVTTSETMTCWLRATGTKGRSSWGAALTNATMHKDINTLVATIVEGEGFLPFGVLMCFFVT